MKTEMYFYAGVAIFAILCLIYVNLPIVDNSFDYKVNDTITLHVEDRDSIFSSKQYQIYEGQESEDYLKIMNDPSFNRQLDGIYDKMKSLNLSEGECFNLIITSLQNMEMANRSYIATPHEMFTNGNSDCDERVLVASGLLHRFNYDVGIAYLNPVNVSDSEGHAFLSFYNKSKNYFFIELTEKDFQTYNVDLELWKFTEYYDKPQFVWWSIPKNIVDVRLSNNYEQFIYEGVKRNIAMFRIIPMV